MQGTFRGASRVWVPVLLCLLFVVARAIWLDVDPPPRLPGGHSLRDIVVEPIAKASEARNYALFGRWSPNPVDDYQFWRPQAPVWVYPLTAFFKLFGVGLSQLRCFAIVYNLLGFLAVLAIARLRLRGVAFFACGCFVALDVLYALYSRSAMLEPAVNSWVSAAVLCVLLARRHWAFLVIAQWAFALGFFTKAAGFAASPVLLGASVWLLWRVPGATNRGAARAAVLLSALLLAGLTFAYVSSDFYRRALIWNFNHVLLSKTEPQAMLVDSLSWAGVWQSVTNPEKHLNFALTLPVTGPLALVEVLAVVVALLRRRSVDPWRVIVVGWLLSAFVTLLFVGSALRFNAILPVPAALVAAASLERISRFVARRPFAVRTRVALTALVVFGTFNGWMFKRLYETRLYTIRDASRALIEEIGARRAAIIGFSSAAPVFSTPYEHYYVKNKFNVSRESLESLRVTHLLFSDESDFTEKIVRRRFPNVMRDLKATRTIQAFTATLKLYPLPDTLRASKKKK